MHRLLMLGNLAKTMLQGNVHVPKIASVIIVVLAAGTRLCTGEVGVQLAGLLASLSPPAELLQAELTKLSSDKQRANVQSYISGTAPAPTED
jgi:hypothetical protein